MGPPEGHRRDVAPGVGNLLPETKLSADQVTEAVLDLSMARYGSRLAESRVEPDVVFATMPLEVAARRCELTDERLPLQTAISITLV